MSKKQPPEKDFINKFAIIITIQLLLMMFFFSIMSNEFKKKANEYYKQGYDDASKNCFNILYKKKVEAVDGYYNPYKMIYSSNVTFNLSVLQICQEEP
jgi:hypothetical protein